MKFKKKIYQIWECESCTTFAEKHDNIKTIAAMGCDEGVEPVLIGEIEAYDWNEAMTKYHEFMGWEPYQPMDDELGCSDEQGS